MTRYPKPPFRIEILGGSDAYYDWAPAGTQHTVTRLFDKPGRMGIEIAVKNSGWVYFHRTDFKVINDGWRIFYKTI